MGIVVDLRGRHAAASRKEASVSHVTSGHPRLAAKPTKPGQRAGGMPRRRQVLTVVSSTPSSGATTEFPPKVSITVPGVMGSTIVGEPPTCQELAKGRLTGPVAYVPIDGMASEAEIIGRRLEWTRRALGYEQASDFAKAINVDKGSVSHWEKGDRPLTLAGALKIRDRFGVSLDWIFCGEKAQLRGDLYEKIERIRQAA